MQNHLHTNKPNEEIPFAGEVQILYYLKPCKLTQKKRPPSECHQIDKNKV
jgi:hypothetical protein